MKRFATLCSKVVCILSLCGVVSGCASVWSCHVAHTREVRSFDEVSIILVRGNVAVDSIDGYIGSNSREDKVLGKVVEDGRSAIEVLPGNHHLQVIYHYVSGAGDPGERGDRIDLAVETLAGHVYETVPTIHGTIPTGYMRDLGSPDRPGGSWVRWTCELRDVTHDPTTSKWMERLKSRRRMLSPRIGDNYTRPTFLPPLNETVRPMQ